MTRICTKCKQEMSVYEMPDSEKHLFQSDYTHYRCENAKCENTDGIHVKTEIALEKYNNDETNTEETIEKLKETIIAVEQASEILNEINEMDEIKELERKKLDLEYEIEKINRRIKDAKTDAGADQLEIEINDGMEYIDTAARKITDGWMKSKIGKNTHELLIDDEQRIFLTRIDNSKRKIRAKDMIDKFPFVVQKMVDDGMITIPIEKATGWLKKNKIDPKELNPLMDTNTKSTYGYVIKDGRNIQSNKRQNDDKNVETDK